MGIIELPVKIRVQKYFSAASILIIKVNGKTSGLEPGDESEHLVPPYALEMLPLCGLHIVFLMWYNKRMKKLNKSRHARYLLNLHIVWIPKYRKVVLGPYREALTDILHSIAKDKEWEILAVEVMPDHIHLFVSVPPSISPSEVVKCFKGQSARKLLVEFPELVQQRDYRASFWAPSYFVASAGDVSSETIKAYIEGQYD